ncbi:MAG: hypothetical protein AAGM27_03930 [Cyanobacteria bacterium J06554_3]
MAPILKPSQTATIASQLKTAPKPIPRPRPWIEITKLGGWMFLWLTCLDIGINFLFAFPSPTQRPPSSLERYFDHGRSIQGKLSRTLENPTPEGLKLLNAGWIDPQSWQTEPTTVEAGDDLLVAIYGMSFAKDIGQALIEIDSQITLRNMSSPAAPPSHSFAKFMADTDKKNADVVVIGILASSVQRMRSVSGMSWSYESPTPYTYPYYTLNSENKLVTVEPAIKTGEEFIQSFQTQDEQWQQLKQQMKQYDQPFDSFVFNRNISDRSAIIRLIRRGWANRVRAQSQKGLFTPETGFNPKASEIRTLKVMLSEFVRTAKAADQTPIILLINDQGYGDALPTVLTPHLNSLEAQVLSTHTIASTTNPKNFIDDGHFTKEVNLKIAEALQDLVRDETNAP